MGVPTSWYEWMVLGAYAIPFWCTVLLIVMVFTSTGHRRRRLRTLYAVSPPLTWGLAGVVLASAFAWAPGGEELRGHHDLFEWFIVLGAAAGVGLVTWLVGRVWIVSDRMGRPRGPLGWRLFWVALPLALVVGWWAFRRIRPADKADLAPPPAALAD